MIPAPPVERLALPTLPGTSARSGFPLVATLAPVAVALVLWGVTQSPYSLLFALLGPVVAIGGVVDAGLSRRRGSRREVERFRVALGRLRERIAAEHDRERRRRDLLAPASLVTMRRADGATPAGWDIAVDAALPVRAATGRLASPVTVSGDEPEDASAELRADIEAVRAAAADFDGAALVVDARDGVGIVGPAVASRALARCLAVQVAAQLSPVVTTLSAPSDELAWMSGLPHEVRVVEGSAFRFIGVEASTVLIAWADDVATLPLGCAAILQLDDGAAALVRHPAGEHATGLLPFAASSARARQSAERLRSIATQHGLRPASALLPTRVGLAELLAEAPPDAAGSSPQLSAPIGSDVDGPVVLDLVAHGPHAIVAGTTGSGKSELLVSWVLAIAARYDPDRVAFLLVDFKGGAAFAPLAGLPHVLATLSDLDTRLTNRAIESLRAELRQRERVLAEHRARSIDELPIGVLPRLVIVVDEFAAVVADSPDLHDVFADLAARGRSLGLHLVLCTQRPSGVIRDAVLANVSLRLSLRVTDRGDSVAMVGSDAASRLSLDPRGRAIVFDGTAARELQLAIAAPGDAQRIAASSGESAARSPWCDPLPARIRFEAVGAAGAGERGFGFGFADLPAEQRQPPVAHDPSAHGHLLVMGGPASGVSTALETIAASARSVGYPVSWLPPHPADAWSVLTSELARTDFASRVLVIDDLDRLIDRFDDDYRHEFTDLLRRLAREGSSRGLGLVVGTRRLPGALSQLAALFGSRLLLRHDSRDEYVLAGGDGPQYEPDLPPGSGRWRGAVVQVALPPDDVMREPAVDVPRYRLGDHPVLAVVAPRARDVAARLRASGARVVELGASEPPALDVRRGSAPTVWLGDPDAWNADWASLTTARRELPMVFLGCSPADHRALLRDRELPPPLGHQPDECWLADAGRTVRVIFDAAPASTTTMDSAANGGLDR